MNTLNWIFKNEKGALQTVDFPILVIVILLLIPIIFKIFNIERNILLNL